MSKVLGQNGYEVGLAGRKLELMEELRGEIPTRTFVKVMDLAQADESRRVLRELIDEMGGVDLIVINSGVGGHEPTWEEELQMLRLLLRERSGFCIPVQQSIPRYKGYSASSRQCSRA